MNNNSDAEWEKMLKILNEVMPIPKENELIKSSIMEEHLKLREESIKVNLKIRNHFELIKPEDKKSHDR